MKKGLTASVFTAGAALILLTGCVSTRKYKASENQLAIARNDSAQLAQQVASLNGNVQDVQSKNSALKHSLDSASSSYAVQQKSLDYYQNYFKDQQNAMNQVSDSVKSALTQAGISNGDVQQVNNVVYVRLNEDDLFKKNSTAITSGGKQALDNLAQVIKNQSNVNVFVGGGDSAAGMASSGNMSMDNNAAMSADASAARRPMHHHRAHVASSSSSATATASAQSSGTTPSPAPVHKKIHHRSSSEGSMAIYNGPGHMHNRAWALKQGRMVTVADHFLKNGVPKVNLSLQQPSMNGNGQDKTIKVVIMPKMEDFNPQMNSAAAIR